MKERIWLICFLIVFSIVTSLYSILLISPPPPTQTLTYVGTLTYVEKLHNGGFRAISDTVCHFSDGKQFQIRGDWDFQLGKNYVVTYEFRDTPYWLRVISIVPDD